MEVRFLAAAQEVAGQPAGDGQCFEGTEQPVIEAEDGFYKLAEKASEAWRSLVRLLPTARAEDGLRPQRFAAV